MTDYEDSSYKMDTILSWAIRLSLVWSPVIIIYLMASGCSNTVNTRGLVSRDAIKQTGQLCLGLKADSESCTPIGGYDEKSDRTPLQPAS